MRRCALRPKCRARWVMILEVMSRPSGHLAKIIDFALARKPFTQTHVDSQVSSREEIKTCCRCQTKLKNRSEQRVRAHIF
ncbi:hypothetical protein GEM_4020 [Burkholderia cepacia GG4]|uniref:Uncharacterized protein n=1 Tax=Burkholderia cepacia GG4 TaxID=1009846 RepID=A0A9W3PBC6_BURCE|nr:hypothetical protein GEM_4020 [Burkholderia cepacia GG4]